LSFTWNAILATISVALQFVFDSKSYACNSLSHTISVLALSFDSHAAEYYDIFVTNNRH